MPLRIEITPGIPTPIYRQIVEQVRLGVVTGKLTRGDGLPSVRVLAEQVLVNPNTVAKAYAELSRDGVIETRQGLGMFVANRRPVFAKAERSRRLDLAVDSLLHEAICLDISADEIRKAVDKRLSKLNPPTRRSPKP